jgi:hypothetical protein
VSQFYFDKDSGKVDINNYGIYRLGLTQAEVVDYLHIRELQRGRYKSLLKLEKINKLYEKYAEIAGANTCAVVNGIILYYRHDVLRYSDVLFGITKSSYFD